jgi:hypothetical protein
MQHAFIPRIGELVLWCPHLEGELIFDHDTQTFRMFSPEKKQFLGIPEWRAGTVSQVPEEPVVLEDVVAETEKRWALNMSGFRVETFPDPNSTDKSYSNHYKYVSLSHIRPLNYWQIFLQGIPGESFHPSIKHALTIMSSFSMLDKYHFKGTWPDATIFCKGIFLGAELLIKGDTVRLMPQTSVSLDNPETSVTDVLVIESIRLHLQSCVDDVVSPLLCESTEARLVGKGYTISPDRAYRTPGSTAEPKPLTNDEIIESFECVGMRGYGSWYHLHPQDCSLQISLNQVIGRCFEPEAMMIMFGDQSFGLDMEGVISGREYGRSTDDRIAAGREWFCGDYRIETLALETLNGYEVGKYDDARDLKMWRANLNIIDGTATRGDLRNAKITRDVGRPRVGLIGGRATSSNLEVVGKMSTMVSSAIGLVNPSANPSSQDVTSAAETEAEEESNGEGGGSSDELDVILQPSLLFCEGTEETQRGDYHKSREPSPKRRKQW